MNSAKQVLVIGFVFPEPESSAAGTRILQLIDLFQNQGYLVTFASPAADSEFAANLGELGIKKVSIILNDASFDEFIAHLNPHIVLFDRFLMEEQFGWRVVENCPQAIRILDTEDLHCLRIARQHAWKKQEVFQTEMLFSALAKREIASILRCDLSVMISEYEMHILENVFQINTKILLYLPLFVDQLEISDFNRLPTFEERKHFIFIGNFLHEPNWNAILYLKEEIWPKIRLKLPDAELHIYGAYSSQKVQDLHNLSQGFLIKNRTENVDEVMKNARVCLAPLRFGAGIKGKLLDAMLAGTPNVTTSIGAESMHGDLEWSGFVSDEIDEIVALAVQLYSSKDCWHIAQQNGFDICTKRFKKSDFKTSFSSKLDEIEQNLKKHRNNNFVGEILKHHTLASTKYMSKWIEEKNSKSI